MADILIRGIELPTAEEEARLILITRTGRVIDMLCEEYEAIPNHGRLVDVDAVLEAVEYDDRTNLIEIVHIRSILDEVPTIIPESKEG